MRSTQLLLVLGCTFLPPSLLPGGSKQLEPAVKIPLEGRPTDMSLAPDGKTVAAASEKGPITIFEVATGKKVREFKHLGEYGRVAFAPDGTLLAGSGEGGLKVWDIKTGEESFPFPDKWKPFLKKPDQLLFSPSGQTLVIFDTSKLTFGSMPTGKMMTLPARSTFPMGSIGISWAVFAPDGQLIYKEVTNITNGSSIKITSVIKARDLKTGKERALPYTTSEDKAGGMSSFYAYYSNQNGGFGRVTVSADGKTLLASTGSITIGKGAKFRQFDRQGCSPLLTPDGKTLASNCGSLVLLYDCDSGEELARLIPKGPVGVSSAYVAPAFTPDLRTLVAPGGEQIWIFDVSEIMKERGAK